jgi:uncharacterized membrane protein YdbT with pleckstrin-like domain
MKDKLRESTIKLVFRIIVLIIIFDLFYFAITIIEMIYPSLKEVYISFFNYSTLIHLSLLFLQIFSIAYMFVRWFTNYYVIGNDHIAQIYGIISKTEKTIKYSNLRIVDNKQSVLGRIFNYGDIVLGLIGNDQNFLIKGIDDPNNIVNRIQKSIGSDRQ